MHGGTIRLVELVKRFGDFTAVDGIDLDIGSGEFFSVLGPSGCGKTTTLRLIAGFEAATSGQILVDDEDLATTPPHRRPVNTVFQSYALFPHLTVARNVAYGLRWRKNGDEQVGHGAAGHRRPAPGAAAGLRRTQADPALRRPAAAGGPGPGPDPPTQGAPARRAPRRPRRQAAQGPADGADRAPARGRDHLRVRHPRPGGGPDHVRPPGGDGQRPGRAGGHPRRGLRGAAHGLRRRLPRRGQPAGSRLHPAGRAGHHPPRCVLPRRGPRAIRAAPEP